MNKTTSNAITSICLILVTTAICFFAAVMSAKEIMWMLIRLDVIGR